MESAEYPEFEVYVRILCPQTLFFSISKRGLSQPLGFQQGFPLMDLLTRIVKYADYEERNGLLRSAERHT